MNTPQKPTRATEPERTRRAVAANIRRGDEKAAARLRAHGWTVTPPEEKADPGNE